MMRNFIILLASILLATVLASGAFAKGKKKISHAVGPEDLDRHDAQVTAMLEAGFQPLKHHPNPYPALSPSNVVREVHVDTLGHTTYDFSYNNIADNQIALSSGGAFNGVHMTYMYRTTDANTSRFAAYNYYSKEFGVFFGVLPGFYPADQAGSGWPRVANGPGNSGVYSYHYSTATGLQTHFRKDDGEGNLTFTTDVVVDGDGLWPGIDAQGDLSIVVATDNVTRLPGRIYVSTDGGSNWTLTNWPPLTVPGSQQMANAETSPMIHPDGTRYGLVNLEDSDNTVGGASTAADGALVLNESSDLTSTTGWNTTVIYKFKDVLPGDFFYDPFGLGGSLFSHLQSVYDENGNAHVIFNGPGVQLSASGDTLNRIHDAVYWNSADQQLIALSDPAISRNPAICDSIDARFPGTNWGMSFPHIAMAPGGHILACWEQPELDGSGTGLNYVYGLLGGAPTFRTYSQDIYAAYSPDYGQTWSVPFALAGEPGVVEQFPQLGEMEVVNDSVRVNLLYQIDTNPGRNVTTGTVESDFSWCPMVYKELVIDPQYPLGIGDDPRAGIAAGFELKQNYPNPFNPSTTIEYDLKQAAKVTLEVYNLLGEKMLTLVNGKQNAGSHRVEFDAANLASGIYFYKLSVDNVSATKKMMLMK
ncbi:MAG: T9SS type A sorting domain-containing protein [Calditrichaeota bacterium]|nr:T9SS type A sorting domain-containing protein [Calditrichota bacterium]